MAGKMVIIGGVAAGMSAASKMRRIDSTLDIDVYTDEEYISYAACGIPYYLSGKTEKLSDLIARSFEEFEKEKIYVHPSNFVEKIIPTDKKIVVKNKNGTFEKDYDKLLIATGSGARKVNFFGSGLKNIHTLRNLTDGIMIKNALKAGVKKAVIVGAGYIGVEMVETFTHLGIETIIVEAEDRVLTSLDEEISEKVLQHIQGKNIKVLLNEKVLGFEGSSDYVQRVITDKSEIECDLVILTLGSVPNSQIAEEAGIELTVQNAIKVNQYMETNIPDIYAAGDCASAYHIVYEDDAYIPLGTTANKQGRIAGANMAGEKDSFQGIIGTSITKVMDIGVGRTGLSKKEAEKLGFSIVEVFIEAKDIAGYYPDSKPMSLKLIADAKTHRMIGAQIIGEKHVAKRIDVMAVAIQNGLKVEDIAGVDMSYAPPFSPVWDPFLIATGILEKKLSK